MEWKTSATDREVVNRLNRSLSRPDTNAFSLSYQLLPLWTRFSSDWDFISLKLSPQSTHPLLRHLQRIKMRWKKWWFTLEKKEKWHETKMTGQRKRDHNNSRKGRSGWLCLGTFRLFFAVRSKTSTNARHKSERQQQQRRNNNIHWLAHTLASIHVKKK